MSSSNVSCRGPRQGCSIHSLCQEGNLAKVSESFDRLAAEHGDSAILNCREEYANYTPVHVAAISGHFAVLRYLLQKGGNANGKDGAGLRPLHLAASKGRVDCVGVLLQHGADPLALSPEGRSPREMTASNLIERLLRSAEIIKAAELKGEKLNKLLYCDFSRLQPSCIDRALVVAAQKNRYSNVQQLLLKGASCAAIDKALPFIEDSAQFTALVLVKAVLTNDHNFVASLYKSCQQPNPQQSLTALQKLACNIPLRVSLQKGNASVIQDLIISDDGTAACWSAIELSLRDLNLLSTIKGVESITALLLEKNELTSVPRSITNFQRVNKLELQNNKISSIPDILLGLPCLNILNLSNNFLTTLPELPQWSSSLTQLNLSQNKLLNIPGNPKAPKLRNLYLSGNELTSVPQCITNFSTLEILDLSENKGIQVIPDQMGCLEKLQILNLAGLRLREPPEQFRKSAKDCIAYLKSKLHNAKPFYGMKLMLVGKENRGKTTLVARLQGRDYGNQSTVGVSITEWECDEGPNVFFFSIWDFAGQEEYYATHQCFLSDCSIYILLFNVKDGTHALSEIEPWLNNIAVRARHSYIHIVGTHLDEIPQDQRSSVESLLNTVYKFAKRYIQNVEVHAVSLKHPLENVGELRKSIYQSASQYRAKGELVMGQVIPETYHKLYRYFKKDVVAEVKKNARGPIMTREEYSSVVEQISGTTMEEKGLKSITQFLIDTGALLHYDDYSNNLDELYFVDPSWLCDMMSSIVSIKQKNPYVKDGILLLSNIGFIMRDEKFQSQHFGQYLTLLDRFEIAFALDNQRILIPSLVPKMPPDNIYEQIGRKQMYTRFILLDTLSIPPGFWGRMLSRIMHSVPKLTSAITMSSNRTETFSASTSVKLSADKFLSSLPQSPTSSNVSELNLTYWKSGIYYKEPELYFGVWSLKDMHQLDSDGIIIMASHNLEGKKLYCQLIDIATTLCDAEFPDGDVCKHIAPCPSCVQTNSNQLQFQNMMDVNACLVILNENKNTTTCRQGHIISLADILPDLLLSDIDSRFIMHNNEQLQCDEELLGKGGEAQVYSGTFRGQPVAIKKYKNSITAQSTQQFRQLRKEILLFQKFYHPCLINLIAVCMYPTVDIVLERAPLGSLHELLLIRQQPVNRIVMHRIATQVAAALRAVHNLGIIHRDLKAGNVLLWSLDPESLCHCKLTDFGTATYQAPIGTRDKAQGTKGFTAPEVLGKNGCNYIYNHTSDVFSFAMLLYEMIARREPYHDMKEVARNEAVIRGERPKLMDIPQAETIYYYLTKLMQYCWHEEPSQRPTTSEIVVKTSLSAMQSIMHVLPIQSGKELRASFLVPQLARAGAALESNELWVCSKENNSTEISIYPTATMKCRMHFTIQSTVQLVTMCTDNMWMFTCSGDENSEIQIFNIFTGLKVLEITMNEKDAVSCIVSSGHNVYCGTSQGSCMVFPGDPTKITTNFHPIAVKISDINIDSIVVTSKYLWVSCSCNIFLLNPLTLSFIDVVNTSSKTRDQTFSKKVHPIVKHSLSDSVLESRNRKEIIGQMKLSHNECIIWSSHLHNNSYVQAWDVAQKEPMYIIYTDEHIREVTICSKEGVIVTAIAPALDTLWIGTQSGHILVFANKQLLSWFHPYIMHVCFIECTLCADKAFLISGGMNFKSPIADIIAYESKDNEGQQCDSAGTVIMWEAFSSKLFRQVQMVQENSYTFMDDHSTVRDLITAGKFKDSTHLTD